VVAVFLRWPKSANQWRQFFASENEAYINRRRLNAATSAVSSANHSPFPRFAASAFCRAPKTCGCRRRSISASAFQQLLRVTDEFGLSGFDGAQLTVDRQMGTVLRAFFSACLESLLHPRDMPRHRHRQDRLRDVPAVDVDAADETGVEERRRGLHRPWRATEPAAAFCGAAPWRPVPRRRCRAEAWRSVRGRRPVP